MKQKSVQPAEKTPEQTSPGKTSRLFFIDHMRAFLAILVVLHHVALVYGASVQGYYYVEPPFTDPQAFMTLIVFALVNQSWFMGAFFLLAGYFTPGSYDRKGPSSFLKDKLLRRARASLMHEKKAAFQFKQVNLYYLEPSPSEYVKRE